MNHVSDLQKCLNCKFFRQTDERKKYLIKRFFENEIVNVDKPYAISLFWAWIGSSATCTVAQFFESALYSEKISHQIDWWLLAGHTAVVTAFRLWEKPLQFQAHDTREGFPGKRRSYHFRFHYMYCTLYIVQLFLLYLRHCLLFTFIECASTSFDVQRERATKGF